MSKALDLAKKVLEENDVLMSAIEIYEYAKNKYLDLVNETFSGETPVHTLGANLYVNVKKQDSIFFKCKKGAEAAKFGLKGKKEKYGDLLSYEEYDEPKNTEKSNWLEKHLHKFLVSFMENQKSVHCITIDAGDSSNKKKDVNKWIHPDILGVRFMKEDYEKETVDLMKKNGENTFEIYSFELKRSISGSNADLEFSQAATNSSWANFGYLVAKDIDEEDSDLIEKIERLSRTFGIGVIKLNVKAFNESKVLCYASRNEIDYGVVDRLLKLKNKNINDFFENIVSNHTVTSLILDIFDKPFESDKDGEDFAKKYNMI